MKLINEIGEINWTMLGLIVFGIFFWLSIFYFGFFQTVIWYIVICAIVGIIVKAKEIG